MPAIARFHFTPVRSPPDLLIRDKPPKESRWKWVSKYAVAAIPVGGKSGETTNQKVLMEVGDGKQGLISGEERRSKIKIAEATGGGGRSVGYGWTKMEKNTTQPCPLPTFNTAQLSVIADERRE
mmetsp:Transcript_16391/g.41597  ORF Transcript_16391/g.41597 Transcript_16391/m.41597 type:complete len:124 (+) Transcript_16391:1017-1388(+)